jgi:hypothetical protein
MSCLRRNAVKMLVNSLVYCWLGVKGFPVQLEARALALVGRLRRATTSLAPSTRMNHAARSTCTGPGGVAGGVEEEEAVVWLVGGGGAGDHIVSKRSTPL